MHYILEVFPQEERSRAFECRKTKIEHKKRTEEIKKAGEILVANKGFKKLAPLYRGEDTDNFFCVDSAFKIDKIKTAEKNRQGRRFCHETEAETTVLLIIQILQRFEFLILFKTFYIAEKIVILGKTGDNEIRAKHGKQEEHRSVPPTVNSTKFK